MRRTFEDGDIDSSKIAIVFMLVIDVCCTTTLEAGFADRYRAFIRSLLLLAL